MIVFVLGWLVFVEVTYRLAPVLGRAERWGRFIAVWNWCNVVEGVIVVVGGVPGLLGAPPIIDQACELITIGWALWVEWYATRLAFGVGIDERRWVGPARSVDRDHAGVAGDADRPLTRKRVVGVADADQGQAFGRRGGTGRRAVPGLQGQGDSFDGPTSLSNKFEGADEVADLVVQEAAGFSRRLQ